MTTTDAPTAEPAPRPDLNCPLCGYSLRGLATPRCPECGFEFTWDELIHAERNRHPYLFEFGRKRNVVTFLKTYFATCLPRRFWAGLKPTQSVRVGRLVLYWLLTASVSLLPALLDTTRTVVAQYQTSIAGRAPYVPVPGQPDIYQRTNKHTLFLPVPWSSATRPAVPNAPPPPISWQASTTTSTRFVLKDRLDDEYPLPANPKFWAIPLKEMFGGWYCVNYRWFHATAPSTMFFAGIVLAWPWLTLLATAVFLFSMRRARIRIVHVIRAAVYSADIGLLMTVLWSVTVWLDPSMATGWLLLCCSAFLSAVVGYRSAFAFGRYLHVHRPAATAVAVQLMSLSAAALVLALTTERSHSWWWTIR